MRVGEVRDPDLATHAICDALDQGVGRRIRRRDRQARPKSDLIPGWLR